MTVPKLRFNPAEPLGTEEGDTKEDAIREAFLAARKALYERGFTLEWITRLKADASLALTERYHPKEVTRARELAAKRGYEYIYTKILTKPSTEEFKVIQLRGVAFDQGRQIDDVLVTTIAATGVDAKLAAINKYIHEESIRKS